MLIMSPGGWWRGIGDALNCFTILCLVAVELSARYEIWHPFGCIAGCMFFWSKYRLGNPSIQWIMGTLDWWEFPPYFRSLTVSMLSPNGRHMTVVRAVQETATESRWAWTHYVSNHAGPISTMENAGYENIIKCFAGDRWHITIYHLGWGVWLWCVLWWIQLGYVGRLMVGVDLTNIDLL